ncbi:MAG TPA: tetratricopeptide repeat protein [Gemmatimonadales bacterium]|nr:tetratricopeptide repeat protein [Gemmatimonadales bacterium]
MDTSPSQLLERARERFALNDYFGAIHLLEEVIERGRSYADAHHLLGLCYHLAGQSDRALDLLDEALRINPRYVEAQVHRGIVLGEMGRTTEAERSFDQARHLTVRGVDGIAAHHAGMLANHHAALGEAYAEAGAMDQAIAQYRTALTLGPTFQDLRFRLARLLLEAGRTLEAREALEEIVRARPTSIEARAALGLACYLSGDAASARELWEALHRDHPGDPRAQVYLALLGRGGEQGDE